MRRKTPWSDDQVYEEYPGVGELLGQNRHDAWLTSFNTSPDAVHAILADVIKVGYAVPGRVGQRPMPREDEVDVSWLIEGAQNLEPLSKVLPELMTVSERQFTVQVRMSRRMFQRMLDGSYDPDVSQLKRIAEAVNKPPSFFVEYRRKMLASAMATLMKNHPTIADALYEHLVHMQSSNPERTKFDASNIRNLRDAVTVISRIAQRFNLDVKIRPKR